MANQGSSAANLPNVSDRHPEVANQILAGLSVQLITVSLTAITLLSGLFIFVKDKDNITLPFTIIAVLAAIFYVTSSVIGAYGITSLANNSGNPNLRVNRDALSNQAIALYIAIALSLISLIFVKPNKDSSEIDRINERQIILEKNVIALEKSANQINEKLQKQQIYISELENKLKIISQNARGKVDKK